MGSGVNRQTEVEGRLRNVFACFPDYLRYNFNLTHREGVGALHEKDECAKGDDGDDETKDEGTPRFDI